MRSSKKQPTRWHLKQQDLVTVALQATMTEVDQSLIPEDLECATDEILQALMLSRMSRSARAELSIIKSVQIKSSSQSIAGTLRAPKSSLLAMAMVPLARGSYR